MRPENTAMVLIDDDNDFLSEGGKLHDAVKKVLDSNQVVANINDLLNRAREKGVRVIHVPIVFSPDYSEMGEAPYGIFKAVRDVAAFKRGTLGAEVAEVLDIRDSDVIVDGKSTTCAFATTDLKQRLEQMGITTIALGGLLTNVCIETTMRTAYDLGYEVFMLTDCSATLSEEQ
ncbi:MAG: cysteine hydrolase [Pseudomonadota bacterium]